MKLPSQPLAAAVFMLLLSFAALAQADPPAGSAHELEAPESRRFPTLEQALELATRTGPRARLREATIDVARSSRAGAGVPPIDNPYVEFFFDRSVRPGVTEDLNFMANLWLPVELGGHRSARLGEAEALIDWSEQRAEVSIAELSAAVVAAYGRSLVSAARREALAESLALAREEERLFAAKLSAGDTTALDAKLAEAERARVEALAMQSQAELARSMAELAVLTGEALAPPTLGARVSPPEPRLAYAEEELARSAPLARLAEREAELHEATRERAATESYPALSVILTAGRGDLGETRLGGGLAWTLPMLRHRQSEKARAEAEQVRALAERDLTVGVSAARLAGLRRERHALKRAIEALESGGEQAARGAVDAARETIALGKGEPFRLIAARRDALTLRTMKLELIEREWALVAEHVLLTGELP